ncbi:MAG: leucine-rich repeat domain-containing protein [Clostridia bacterium]|nr:leucine-rich repeat domain-containing protein [Clostridia bacterium]
MQDNEDVYSKNVALNIDRENLKVVDGVLIKYRDHERGSLRIPKGVTELANSSIDTPFITTMHLPASVKIIRKNWVYLAFSLTTLYIENPEVYLEAGCFERSQELKKIYIGGQKIDAVVTQDDEAVYLEKYVGNDKSYKIDNDINIIRANAFRDCKSIESIEFSQSVKDIGMWAFKGCTSLKEVKLSDSINMLCCAFDGCISLEKIDLPDSIFSILSSFEGCRSIKELTVPLSVNHIGRGAFKGWRHNQTIRVPQKFKELRILQKWRKGCRAKIIYY